MSPRVLATRLMTLAGLQLMTRGRPARRPQPRRSRDDLGARHELREGVAEPDRPRPPPCGRDVAGRAASCHEAAAGDRPSDQGSAGPSGPDAHGTARPQPPAPGRAGLDWLSFFCANLQTGFGPFIAAYLTSAKWTQTDIGLVLMIGGLIGLCGQIPGGALVDRTPRKIVVAGLSIGVIGAAALLVAMSSHFAIIMFAWVLHALASCLLTPCIATISLDLVGHGGISRRLGRNATFASVGSALAAAGMGVCGDYISNQAVFFVTAALAVPAALSLVRIAPDRSGSAITPGRGDAELGGPFRATEPPRHGLGDALSALRAFGTDRAMVVLAAAVALFFLANAAMLPLIGSMLTLRSAHNPTMLIAACIIVPQVIVAFFSPAVGAAAQRWGRRPLLLIGLAALPIKGICLGVVTAPAFLIAAQCLDGLSAAVIGVIVPLIAADATRAKGRFALAQGVLGTAMGFGSSFSSTIAGVLTDRFDSQTAFIGLSAIALAALAAAAVAMPETKPSEG